MKNLKSLATAALGAGAIALVSSTVSAQTAVTSFAPETNMIPGVWYEIDVRTGGSASTVDLTGAGGDLENNQPLPVGAAKLTTDLTNAAKAEVAVGNDFGELNDILEDLAVGFSWHKATNAAIGANTFAAPSIKLTFFNSVCDDPASAGDCFVTLVWEAYQDRHAPVPSTDLWTREDLDADTGGWWITGGFGRPNGFGGCGSVPCPTLRDWHTDLSSDFGQATLVAVSVGVGSFNPGQIGYFDDVTISGTNADAEYDFEPALTPANKNECKKGGWMVFNTPVFKNQGDCIQFVNTGK